MYESRISLATLQKPEKVYLDNSNLDFAFSTATPNKGNLRETYFISQVAVRHKVSYPKQGDFLVDDRYTFEVGGKDKTNKQISNVKNGFVASDDVENSITKLPLWLIGFLY